MVFLTYFFPSAGCAEKNEKPPRKMGYRYLGRSVAAFMCAALVPLLGASQCTIFKKDGSQLGVTVQGAANGQLKFSYDPSSGKSNYLACSEVVAYIDEALIVHTDPCDAANKPAGEPAKRNCGSLILRDNSVVKGRITFMEGYAKVQALSGDRNVQESDIVGQITEGDGVMFQNEESVRSLMTNQVVVRAINDIGQCPVAIQPKTGYGPKKAKEKFDAAKKKEAIAKAKARATLPPPGITVVNYKDTVARGLLEVLDFDTFSLIALKKVERLGLYIHQIADKKMSMTLRDKAARQGMDLFENPLTNTVQVSKLIKGKASPTPSNKKVVNYLQTDLKYNKYDEVDIQWADLNYASDFEQQPDGSYQAVISVQQRFVGKVDGVETYSDVTNKNVTVTLRQYEKLTDDGFKKLWDVFLGDIGVSSTQPG